MNERTPVRYDPLPDLSQLPAWVWLRLPRAGKVAVATAPVLGLALVLAFAPSIDRAKDERAHTEAQRQAQTSAERVRQVRAEQRPRFAAGAAASMNPGARERLLEAAGASILADARGRVDLPIRRVACEPFPRTTGAHADPAARYGRYACLAVRFDVPATVSTLAAAIGYPYRVRIDFESGRYGFCKVVGRPGEGMIATQPLVALSPSCGGV